MLPDKAFKSLLEDAEGNIWIGCAKGLFRHRQDTEQLEQIKANSKDSTQLSSNRIRVIYKDSQQRIWVGTADHGLN